MRRFMVRRTHCSRRRTARIVHMPDLAQLPSELRPDRLDGLILTGAMVNQFALAADTPAMKQLRKLPSVWVIGDPPVLGATP